MEGEGNRGILWWVNAESTSQVPEMVINRGGYSIDNRHGGPNRHEGIGRGSVSEL